MIFQSGLSMTQRKKKAAGTAEAGAKAGPARAPKGPRKAASAAGGPDAVPGYVPDLVVRKIVSAIESRHISRVAVEAEAGLAQYRIYNWEQRSGTPNVLQAVRIARAIDVPLEYLLDEDQPVLDPPPRLLDRSSVSLVDAARSVGVTLAQVKQSLVVIKVMASLGLDGDAAIKRLSIEPAEAARWDHRRGDDVVAEEKKKDRPEEGGRKRTGH